MAPAVQLQREHDVSKVLTPPVPPICASHEYVERTLEALVVKVDTGFSALNETLIDMRVDLGRREESEKGQWHEIRSMREKVEEFPSAIAAAVADHVAGCPLNDITEVGIKVQKDRRHQDAYDTPTHLRRTTQGPRALRLSNRAVVLIGIGIAGVLLVAGIWIGGMVVSGSASAATGAVRSVAGTAVHGNGGQ